MNLKSERLWSIILAVIVVGLILFIWMSSSANASTINENYRVTLCHKTHSEKNPWVKQTVNANQVQSHLDNGDFLITENHPCPPVTPTPTVTPTATPSATPTPFDFARDAVDKCTNLDGIQTVIPQGMFLNDKTQCEDIVKNTPAPAVLAKVTELPDTGDNSLFGYLALILGLIGIGSIGSVWATKKLKD
jgi:LPXTG-motif cell wall-anchored protein